MNWKSPSDSPFTVNKSNQINFISLSPFTWQPYLKLPLKKSTKISFKDQLSLNAGQMYCRMLQGEHSAILSTFIKLP